MPKLARITIFPLKSFDAQPVDRAMMLATGALEHDRRFALRDQYGQLLTAKHVSSVHLVRTHFDPATNRLTLRAAGDVEQEFDLARERVKAGRWFSERFGMQLELVENLENGFPDDLESLGPTLVSQGTMEEIGRWFVGVPPDEVRGRFRANLEIEADEPFWEDRLVAEAPRAVHFRIGSAELLGTNPCQRCPVPTRNPTTGEAIREFAKTFAHRRREALPEWAPKARFDHFYRLAVNTRPVAGKTGEIRVGDELEILGTV